MSPLSKIALASATLAAITALTACGGGGGGDASTNNVPVVTGVEYPSASVFNPVFSSMYTLTTSAFCGELDAYCRLVAGKEAIVDVELDDSVTAFKLQITVDDTLALMALTAPADCNTACWNDAKNKPGAALQLPGTRLNTAKNIFRVRVPAHLNMPSLYWLASFEGTFSTDTGPVSKNYIPRRLTRNYFKGDPIDLVVVPMRINGLAPTNLPTIFQIANNVGVKIPLPVASIRIGATLDIPNITALATTDQYNALLRAFTQQSNAQSGRTYWYGLFNQAIRNGGLAGIGYQPGNSAIGWDDLNQWYRTMTHEMGHNLGLPHAPCGNPGGIDPSYPYPNGDLYAPFPSPTAFRYAFDLNQGLEQVQENKDVMGYCGGNYFSDYNIANIWRFMQPRTATSSNAAAGNTITAAPIPARSLAAERTSYTLDDVHKRWNTTPPQPTQGPTTMGHLFAWKSGSSNAPVLEKITTAPEKSLPGIVVQVQHADGDWYTGVAYRTSEESSLDIWTPGIGTPIAIRIPGM